MRLALIALVVLAGCATADARPHKVQYVICWDGSRVAYGTPCPVQPPAPTPSPITAGSQVKVMLACSAANRPETSVVGDQYTVVEFYGLSGAETDVVLTNATHPGDGYFSMYLPMGCIQ